MKPKVQRSWNSTLRRITPKTAARNQKWKGICLERIAFLGMKYGRLLCEWCGEQGMLNSQSFRAVWGHHKDGDRNNCAIDNCYIVHHTCHHFITEHHVDVRIYKNKKEWDLAK